MINSKKRARSNLDRDYSPELNDSMVTDTSSDEESEREPFSAADRWISTVNSVDHGTQMDPSYSVLDLYPTIDTIVKIASHKLRAALQIQYTSLLKDKLDQSLDDPHEYGSGVRWWMPNTLKLYMDSYGDSALIRYCALVSKESNQPPFKRPEFLRSIYRSKWKTYHIDFDVHWASRNKLVEFFRSLRHNSPEFNVYTSWTRYIERTQNTPCTTLVHDDDAVGLKQFVSSFPTPEQWRAASQANLGYSPPLYHYNLPAVFECIKSGKLAMFNMLMDHFGPRALETQPILEGKGLVYHAVQHQRIEMFRRLLSMGFDVNVGGTIFAAVGLCKVIDDELDDVTTVYFWALVNKGANLHARDSMNRNLLQHIEDDEDGYAQEYDDDVHKFLRGYNDPLSIELGKERYRNSKHSLIHGECTLCLQNTTLAGDNCVFPCFHLFHCACLRDSPDELTACPTCRLEF